MVKFLRCFLVLSLFFCQRFCYSQQLSSCVNADFEQNSFLNWTGSTGSCCPISMFANGIVTGRHTIMSGSGFDPHSNGQIPVVAPGGTYSARLGNDNTNSEAEQLRYSFTVTPQTELFIYRYAVILEDPVHDVTEQPRFEIRVFDQNNNAVGCGTYNVVSGGGIPNFQTWYDMSTGSDIHFQTWQTVGIELSTYMGQTVTIEFSTGDCSLGGHFGYAYVDAYCSPLVVASDYCPGSTSAILTAPTGFASYLWSNGATTQSITVNNPTIGAQYDVTLTSVTGCQVTLTQVITVTSIVANFIASPSCQNGTVFTDSSYVLSGSPVTQWNWNFGDGQTSTLQNTSHSFAVSGNHNVQLIVENAGGCIDTIIKTINISPAPVADFSVVTDCPGVPVVFTNLSTFAQGTITGQTWNFGDASPANSNVNTTHAYATEGPYTATLIVQGNNGCTDTASYQVQTKPAPVAAFNFSVQCQSNTVSFTDASTLTGGNITSWKWDFGDGSAVSTTQSPVHVYTSNGPFSVQLIVTGNNGCTDTISQSVTMSTPPIANFTTLNACANQSVQFTDLSALAGGAISSWKWYFGDGGTSVLKNPLHVYTNQGNYNVSLAVVGNNGCSDSIAMPVTVKLSPIADFTSAPVCPTQQSTFTGTTSFPGGTLSAFEWNFGDGTGVAWTVNSTYTYATAGTYSVMYIVEGTNGCRDTVIKSVTTSVTPVARFNAPSGCAVTPLLFSSSSIIASGSITDWAWNFGDGSPAVNGQSTSHAFASSGSFNVSLTVTSNNGCTHSVMHEVSVSDKPIPNFVSNLGCEGDSTHLINTSTTPNGTINYIKWSFGDGGTLTNVNDLYHHYADSGYYSVELIVSNSIGCSDTIEKYVYVKALPNPGFVWENICEGAPALFTDTSTLVNGTVTAWQWDFGTGPVSYQQQSNYTFTNAGNGTATVMVTGSNGCRATLSKNVTIHPKPEAKFVPTTGCVNSLVGLINQSIITAGTIDSMFWNYDDGSAISHFINGSHTYVADGVYNVMLIAQSNIGCRDTVVDTVKIYPLPIANFTATTVCLNQPTAFTDLSNAVTDSLVLWRWYFGDGNSSPGSSPFHTYASDSSYLAMLVVWNNRGCKDTLIKSVTVKPLPKVGFTLSNPCVNGAIAFQDSSALPGYSINSWQWNFGDSASATTASASHTYNQFGQYTVTLVVSATNGCTDSLSQNITVNRLPLAAFAAPNVCEGTALLVNNQSQLVNGSITEWLWNWGDAATDTTASPSHLYAANGSYTIYLKVTGSNGCVNDTTVTVTIYDKPVADFSHTNPCQLAPVDFTDLSMVSNDTLNTWQWSFNDGTYSADENPVHAFSGNQVYNVQLIVNSGYGCADTIVQTISVAPKPVAGFTSQNVCLNNPMLFNNNSGVANGSITKHTWDFGDSSGSIVMNPQHIYGSTGNKSIQLIVESDKNCYDTAIAQYRVYELPEALFTADTLEGCQPFFVDLDDLSSAQEGVITRWEWDFGDGEVDMIQNPDVRVYNEPGYFDIELLVETDLGCLDTLLLDNYIHVFAKPVASFSTDPSTTTILHPVVDFTDESYGASYWLYDFSDSTTSVEQNPTHWFAQPADYMVIQYATSNEGCVDTTFRYIEIKNDFAFYIPNSFTPNSDSKNEAFRAYGIGITDYSMQIFNRWGQLIFTSGNMEDGWDGTYKSEKVKNGSYVYVVKARDIFNKPHIYHGTVTLVR